MNRNILTAIIFIAAVYSACGGNGYLSGSWGCTESTYSGIVPDGPPGSYGVNLASFGNSFGEMTGTTSRRIGDVTYYTSACGRQVTSRRIGDITYYTDANGVQSTARRIGDVTYYTDANGKQSTARRIGDVTYIRDDAGNSVTAREIGDVTHFTDDAGNSVTARRIGGTTYIDGMSGLGSTVCGSTGLTRGGNQGRSSESGIEPNALVIPVYDVIQERQRRGAGEGRSRRTDGMMRSTDFDSMGITIGAPPPVVPVR